MVVRLRQLILRSPPPLTVAVVVACSVLLSVLSLVALHALAGLGFNRGFVQALVIATVIPLVVATPVSWVIVTLVGQVDAARHAAQELAWKDELTGLLNRRRFVELARRELELAHRSGQALAVALIDVDDFKAINDQHGHSAGDEVLRALADKVRRELRGTDLVGRWGGEEFALLLPGSDLPEVLTALRRVLAAVRATRFGAPGESSFTCTASIGVTVRRPEVWGLEALMAEADAAMYRSKAAGKDRIDVAPACEAGAAEAV